MEAGRDVLIVYDDLTHHARSYRELSLLLRRPPGREAFPGDIFYIHSRLLERATHLRKERGGGSLTALPIIETDAQDISAYIPTNLISITDGQIYLSPTLFELGILPAVDVGKSVSRVGGEAQRAAYRSVAGDLKLAYSQFEELESFAKFGTRLDESTRRIIEHGRRIRACLKQPESQPVSMLEQIAVLLALTAGLFDTVPLEKAADAERALRGAAAAIAPDLAGRLTSTDKLGDADRKAVLDIATGALAPFQPPPDAKASAQTAPDAKPDAKPASDSKASATPAPGPKPAENPTPGAKAAAQPTPGAKPDAKPAGDPKAPAAPAPDPRLAAIPPPDVKAATQPAPETMRVEKPPSEAKAAAPAPSPKPSERPAPVAEPDSTPTGKPAP